MCSRIRTASGRSGSGRRRQRPTEPGTRIEEPVDIRVVLIGVRYITLGIVGDTTSAPGWQLLPGQLLAVGGLNLCRPCTEGAEQLKVRLGIPTIDVQLGAEPAAGGEVTRVLGPFDARRQGDPVVL